MKKIIFCLALAIACSTTIASDEMPRLEVMAKDSEEYRNLSIDCLIEMKVSKEEGWNTKQCLNYQSFVKNTLPVFKNEVKANASSFREYSKSSDTSEIMEKRGLKQLQIINENMASIKSITRKIKARQTQNNVFVGTF